MKSGEQPGANVRLRMDFVTVREAMGAAALLILVAFDLECLEEGLAPG